MECVFTQHFERKWHRSEEMNRNYLQIVTQQAMCAGGRQTYGLAHTGFRTLLG